MSPEKHTPSQRHEDLFSAWTSMQGAGERGTAIMACCYLDDLLEALLRSAYIKDKNVDALFKDDRMLQSFFNKISIAYFSGLLPSFIYHDLRLICEIRNRFAHKLVPELTFNANDIKQRILKCELRPQTFEPDFMPMAQYLVIVIELGFYLDRLNYIISHNDPRGCIHYGEIDISDTPHEEWAITKEQVLSILKQKRDGQLAP